MLYQSIEYRCFTASQKIALGGVKMALLSDPIELEVDRATHALRLQNLPSGSLYRPDRKNSFGEYDVALFEYNYSLE